MEPRKQDDEAFWQEFARDVEALRSDPEAWAGYQAEAALWDRALAGDECLDADHG